MSIKYTIIGRGKPGIGGGEDKKFYALAKTTGEVDLDQMTASIEKISTVSGADIRAVLYALVDIASNELADGKIVRLGDLGSLRVSISSHGCETADAVKPDAIKASKILFFSGKKLKQMIKLLTYQKIS